MTRKTYYSFCQVYICCYVLYILALCRIWNRIGNCFLRAFIIHWLVCLYCHGTVHCTNLFFFLFFLTSFFSCIAFQYFGWNIFKILPKLQKPALKVHVLWFKTGIYSCNLSEKVSLMYKNSFPIPLLYNLKNISRYFIHNSMKSSCK